jgi:hypothetical protein
LIAGEQGIEDEIFDPPIFARKLPFAAKAYSAA